MELRDYAGKKIEEFKITAFMNMERAVGGCFDSRVVFAGREINHDFVEGPMNQLFTETSSYRRPNVVKLSEQEMFRAMERVIRKCIEQRIQQANNLLDQSWLETVSDV
jgi:hypothetical protein